MGCAFFELSKSQVHQKKIVCTSSGGEAAAVGGVTVGVDADEEEAAYFPEFAVRAEKLLEAQRAWIVYRDAECALDYAEWGAGSMRNIAHADCRLQMTAERTIELRRMREMFQ